MGAGRAFSRGAKLPRGERLTAARPALHDFESVGVEIRPGRGLNLLDPWGNYVQVVQYDEVQFTKADRVLQGMGFDLGKTDRALDELRSKGLA